MGKIKLLLSMTMTALFVGLMFLTSYIAIRRQAMDAQYDNDQRNIRRRLLLPSILMTDPKTIEQKVDTTTIAQHQQFPWDYNVMGNYQNNRVYSMNTKQHEVHRGMGSYQNPTTIKLFLPNILFLGAQKSGSTSISQWLFEGGVCQAHTYEGDPEYFAKEVHFFDKVDRYEQGMQFYSQRFLHCQRPDIDLTMDATPDYLTFPDRIIEGYTKANALDTLKVMFIVREPVSRELSLYNHAHYYNKDLPPTFEEYAEVTLKERISNPKKVEHHHGKYIDHLKKLASAISRDRILVLSYDEVKADPEKVQWRIEQFIGREVPGGLQTLNSHSSVKKQTGVSEHAMQVLQPLFEAKNQELYQFLNDNPGPWMEQHPFPPFQYSRRRRLWSPKLIADPKTVEQADRETHYDDNESIRNRISFNGGTINLRHEVNEQHPTVDIPGLPNLLLLGAQKSGSTSVSFCYLVFSIYMRLNIHSSPPHHSI